MFVIGERINGMFKVVKAAIQENDKTPIQALARDQVEAGARALDVNVGPAAADAVSAMTWLVDVIQEVTDVPLAIDSPKLEVLEASLERCKNKAIINSTTGTEEQLDKITSIAVKYGASLIGLTIDEKGIPRDADGRSEIALRILTTAMEKGLAVEDLYVDPVILPCNVAQVQSGHVLETIRQLKLLADPAPKTNLGLSNVSQGTKRRALINRVYLVMAIAAGLEGAIMDPLDNDLMDAAITADVLMNKNIYCDSFLEAYRK